MAVLADMSWRDFQRAVRAQAREHGIPAFGTFELTPLCNFNCKMCYVHLTPERMHELGRLRTAEEWLDMARQARDAGMVYVALTGGEVLTRQDFAEIYSGLVDMGLSVSILSNGSLVDKEIVNLFRRFPPSYIRFTLYGSSNETYERLCGVSDGFDRVTRGMKSLHDAGIAFSLSMTLTKLNVDDLAEVQALAKRFEAPLVVGSTLVSAVRGATSQSSDLEIERPRYVIGNCPDDCASDYEIDATPVSTDPFARCGSYRSSFWIDWNGDMDMCSFMSSCKVSPFDDGFSQSWSELLDKLSKIKRPEKCLTCANAYRCAACPGVIEAETGSPMLVSDSLCSKVCSFSV